MKRFYECTFIVNPGMDDAQIENTVKMVEDTITKNGGEMVSTEHIGRRRLAYPITKKHNGYYVSLEFEAEGRIIEKVERFLTLDENVMRYLTISLDHRELAAKRARAAFLQEQKDIENGVSRPEGAEAVAPVASPAPPTIEAAVEEAIPAPAEEDKEDA